MMDFEIDRPERSAVHFDAMERRLPAKLMQRLVVLLLAATLAVPPAQAWGPVGHRTVGAIADQLLKGSRAQQQLAALLLPGESLASLANWADCPKPGLFCGPLTAEMQAYLDRNPRHSNYHFIDIPLSQGRYRSDLPGGHEDNIVLIMQQAIGVLQAKGAPNPHQFTRREALLLLVHLVGDIHQPLHVGAAYASEEGGWAFGPGPYDPLGGSNYLLDDAMLADASARQLPPRLGEEPPDGAMARSTRSLHAYWDSTAVDYAMRRSGVRNHDQFAARLLEPTSALAPDSGDASTWPAQWASDTLQATKLAYAGVVPRKMEKRTSKKGTQYGVWQLDLPADYPVTSSAIARDQISRAGHRLAALLTAIL
jgi:hypothetical protein